MQWSQYSQRWPNAQRSEHLTVGECRFHLQRWINPQIKRNPRPLLLLLHGTGSSTHSFSGLAPLLAEHFDLLIVDLPGHGFSNPVPAHAMSLPGMAQAVRSLLRYLEAEPAGIVGHSAGAAVAIQLELDSVSATNRPCIISLNGALVPFGHYHLPGMSWFSKVMATQSWIPWVFAMQARALPVTSFLIDSTGSKIPEQNIWCYQQLFADRQHVSGALRMMANWDLRSFYERLPELKNRLLIISTTEDRTVSPAISMKAHQAVKHSEWLSVPGLGHLAHEEQPEPFAAAIVRFMTRV